MSGSLRRERFAVLGPRRLIGNELDEFRIALRAAELAPAFHRHAEAQEEDLALHCQRRLAPDHRLLGSVVLEIRKLEIEGERGRYKSEHRQLAVKPHIARELNRRRLPVEIDAR